MGQLIVVEDKAIRIEGLLLTSPDVVQYFKQVDELRRAEVAVSAFELGVFCLQRAQVGGSLEFVRTEIERLIGAARGAISAVPGDLLTKLQGDAGPLGAVRSATQQAESTMRGKLDDVKVLFDNHLDPRNSESTLGRSLARLHILLDPQHDDSVQKRVERAIDSIASVDGKLASAVKKAVEDGTSALRQGVDGLRNAVVGEEAEREVLGRTPEKGYEFEEELKPGLQSWAAAVGAEAPMHVGPQNVPGDFVITLKDTSLAAVPFKIVIEARDREAGWGRARITGQMQAALTQWNGSYGIYVSRDQTGLAAEIGEWSELSCESGPIIACVAEHLRTALRFAVVDTKLREAARARKEVDMSTVTAQLGSFRTALNHLTQIKRSVTGIRSGLESIDTEADDMRAEIDDALRQIETALPH